MQNKPDHRELLELAAKAADYRVFWHHANQCHMIVEGVSERKWKPLEDSGDALRLAVAAGLRIEIDTIFDKTHCVVLRDTNWCTAPHNDDPNAATCLAIVHAAANSKRIAS